LKILNWLLSNIGVIIGLIILISMIIGIILSIKDVKNKNKEQKPIYKKVWFWLIAIPLLLMPITINEFYKFGPNNFGYQTDWKTSDALQYYGSLLTFIGTIFLGIVAFLQNDRANKIAEDDINVSKQAYLLEASKNPPFLEIDEGKIYKQTFSSNHIIPNNKVNFPQEDNQYIVEIPLDDNYNNDDDKHKYYVCTISLEIKDNSDANIFGIKLSNFEFINININKIDNIKLPVNNNFTKYQSNNNNTYKYTLKLFNIKDLSNKEISLEFKIITMNNYIFTQKINITFENKITTVRYFPVKLIGDNIENNIKEIEKNTNFNISGNKLIRYYGNDEHIEIENSITEIDGRAFANCKNLIEITIPKSVTKIGELVFSGCENLKNINIDKDNNNFIFENGVLYTKDKSTIKCYLQNNKNKKINIPKGITSIDNMAFYNCKNLINIKIYKSVKNIGNEAFANCKNLTSINIPSSVTNIGTKVFFGCENLTNINIDKSNNNFIFEEGVLYSKDKSTIKCYLQNNKNTKYITPETVNKIDYSAFFNCKNIEEIIMSNNSNRTNENNSDDHAIGAVAFEECINLKKIVISDNIREIHILAFYNCKKLHEINIPKSVNYIDAGVFNGCENLTNINIDKDNNNFIFEDGILYSKDKRTIICYLQSNENTEYTIKDIKVIEGRAFYDCKNIQNITILEGVITIGFLAFYNCKNLTEITIPNSVTDIGNGAFEGCSKELTIRTSKNSKAHEYANSHNIPLIIPPEN